MSEAEKKVKKVKKTVEDAPAPEADGAAPKKKKKVAEEPVAAEVAPADGVEKKKKKKADAEAPAEAPEAEGDKKKKKKKAEDAPTEAAPAQPAVTEEVAPVEGEKKKKKKTEAAPAETAAPVATEAPPVVQNQTSNKAELVFNNVRSKEYAESISKLIAVIAKHKGSVNVTVHLSGAPTQAADEKSAEITRRLNEFLQQLEQPSA